jgi:hypothetical protein
MCTYVNSARKAGIWAGLQNNTNVLNCWVVQSLLGMSEAMMEATSVPECDVEDDMATKCPWVPDVDELVEEAMAAKASPAAGSSAPVALPGAGVSPAPAGKSGAAAPTGAPLEALSVALLVLLVTLVLL